MNRWGGRFHNYKAHTITKHLEIEPPRLAQEWQQNPPKIGSVMMVMFSFDDLMINSCGREAMAATAQTTQTTLSLACLLE